MNDIFYSLLVATIGTVILTFVCLLLCSSWGLYVIPFIGGYFLKCQLGDI